MFRPRPGLWLPLVLLVTAAAYTPALWNGYAMDDRLIAMGTHRGEKHPMVHDLRPVGDYFRTNYWYGRGPNQGLYRPVTVWSYALVHDAFRPAVADPADVEQRRTAFPQHLLNLLLHCAAAAAAYALIRRLRVGVGPAAVGALVFGLHAIHGEVVATVVGRAELGAFVFGAAAVLLLWIDAGDRRWLPWATWPAAALLLFVALCSKESAVGWIGFLAVFAAADAWRNAAAGGVRLAARCFALRLPVALVPLIIFLFLRAGMLSGANIEPVAYMVNPLAHEPTLVRLLTALFVWGTKGIATTLLPFSLSADHGVAVFPILTSPLELRLAPALGLLAFALIVGLAVARRHPLVFLAATTFLGFSFITSNVPFAIGTIFGERLYYTPSLGLSFLAVWLVERGVERPALRKVTVVVGVLWLVGCSVVILQRNRIWDSDESLFLTEVERQPSSARLHLVTATLLAERGDTGGAEGHLRTAVQLDPTNGTAWNSLAAIPFSRGDLKTAETMLRRGLEARHVTRRADRPRIRCNLGIAIARQGRAEEARGHLEAALRELPIHDRSWRELVTLDPSPAGHRRRLAMLADWRRAEPGNPHWPCYGGVALAALGRWDEAVGALGQALTLRPDLAAAWDALLQAAPRARPAVVDPIVERLMGAPRTPEVYRRRAADQIRPR